MDARIGPEFVLQMYTMAHLYQPALWFGTAGAVADRLRDFFVPPTCIACDRRVGRQGGLCPQCWGQMHFIERPYCEVLGLPFAHDHGEGAVSATAMAHPPPFDRLRSAVIYDDLSRQLVSGLKFADRTDLAPWIAQMMSVAGRELIAECDLVCAVPLHRRRLLSRRYNQSAELARAIARAAAKPFEPLVLQRVRATPSQIGLTADQRERNVSGAFRVPAERRGQFSGRRILLVDDVYTSGATVRACARSLRRAGAAGIDILTFARVADGHI